MIVLGGVLLFFMCRCMNDLYDKRKDPDGNATVSPSDESSRRQNVRFSSCLHLLVSITVDTQFTLFVYADTSTIKTAVFSFFPSFLFFCIIVVNFIMLHYNVLREFVALCFIIINFILYTDGFTSNPTYDATVCKFLPCSTKVDIKCDEPK
jgi:hypothetical protein